MKPAEPILSEKSKKKHVRLRGSVRTFFVTFFFSLIMLLPTVLTQERYNVLSINGERHDEVGPFYFMKQGNNKDAYAKANELAIALGMTLELGTEEIIFSLGEDRVSVALSSNIILALEKSKDALKVNGSPLESPMAIEVEGEIYVAIHSIAKAFGFESDWLADTLTVAVTAPESTAPAAATLITLKEPRIGVQENGSSRVVIDLPKGIVYSLLIKDKVFVVQFSNVGLVDFYKTVDDDNLETVQFAMLNGKPSLVVTTKYALEASGKGFKRGALAANDNNPNERLFIDFSPQLEGSSVNLAETLELDKPDLSTVGLAHVPIKGKKTVVIDAGHGGKDPGAVSKYAVEQEVALNIALKLRDYLERAGVSVVMTRDTNVFLELKERANFATPEVNLFVSVHVNSFSDEAAHGIETYVFGQPLNDSLIALAIKENGGGSQGRELTEGAKNFAQSIQGQIYRETQLQYSLELAEMVQNQLIASTSARDRGVKQNLFAVLQFSRSPAILVETGFIGNTEEGPKLASDSYQETLAHAIATGVIRFLSEGGLKASAKP